MSEQFIRCDSGDRGRGDLGPETVEITILILETNCASCHSSHQSGVQHSNLKILVFFFRYFYNTLIQTLSGVEWLDEKGG